jgi:hypothetical protein
MHGTVAPAAVGIVVVEAVAIAVVEAAGIAAAEVAAATRRRKATERLIYRKRLDLEPFQPLLEYAWPVWNHFKSRLFPLHRAVPSHIDDAASPKVFCKFS